MNKKTAIAIIRQFVSVFESKKEFEWLVEAMIFIDKLVEDQQKEIEEKTTILLAGAEKVKQLEKGNRSLMESRKKWKNRYYKEKAKNKECISKDKIRELLEEYRCTGYYEVEHVLKELLEEN